MSSLLVKILLQVCTLIFITVCCIFYDIDHFSNILFYVALAMYLAFRWIDVHDDEPELEPHDIEPIVQDDYDSDSDSDSEYNVEEDDRIVTIKNDFEKLSDEDKKFCLMSREEILILFLEGYSLDSLGLPENDEFKEFMTKLKSLRSIAIWFQNSNNPDVDHASLVYAYGSNFPMAFVEHMNKAIELNNYFNNYFVNDENNQLYKLHHAVQDFLQTEELTSELKDVDYQKMVEENFPMKKYSKKCNS